MKTKLYKLYKLYKYIYIYYNSYPFFGALDHDAHHEHFDVNYGVGVFMDKLFGTMFEGSELEKKVLARQNRDSSKKNKSS
jgi:sterol desaturase/sphingolipid hydroxylase (fatty acid hydroxylase superfamily)